MGCFTSIYRHLYMLVFDQYMASIYGIRPMFLQLLRSIGLFQIFDTNPYLSRNVFCTLVSWYILVYSIAKLFIKKFPIWVPNKLDVLLFLCIWGFVQALNVLLSGAERLSIFLQEMEDWKSYFVILIFILLCNSNIYFTCQQILLTIF